METIVINEQQRLTYFNSHAGTLKVDENGKEWILIWDGENAPYWSIIPSKTDTKIGDKISS